jgi:hypothetical protein
MVAMLQRLDARSLFFRPQLSVRSFLPFFLKIFRNRLSGHSSKCARTFPHNLFNLGHSPIIHGTKKRAPLTLIVWSGHSCPLPSTLTLILTGKGTAFSRAAKQSLERARLQPRRTCHQRGRAALSAPLKAPTTKPGLSLLATTSSSGPGRMDNLLKDHSHPPRVTSPRRCGASRFPNTCQTPSRIPCCLP